MKYSCKQCGACCRWEGYVRLKDSEVVEIAQYLCLDISEFTKKYTILTEDRTTLSLVEKDDGSCVFLSGKNKCIINDVKPVQCKLFPNFWNFPGFEEECLAGAEVKKQEKT